MYNLDTLTRYIIGFSKTPDKFGEFLAEVVYEFIKPVQLIFLQNLFGIPQDYPDEGVRYMIDGFPIDKAKAVALSPFLNEPLDLIKYNCFLECSDTESFQKWKENFGKERYKPKHGDLTRFIDAYPKEPDENGELWSVRFELQKPISIEFLNELFHVDPNDDEIFWGDELNEEQAKALQPYFNEKLDLMRYDLYLDAKRKPVDDKK